MFVDQIDDSLQAIQLIKPVYLKNQIKYNSLVQSGKKIQKYFKRNFTHKCSYLN